MSYNTDLQTNNVNLQAILDTVNNLPEAGGSSIETCTVTLLGASSSYRPYNYSYTAIDTNGNIDCFAVTVNSSTSVTLENVVKGSVVTVSWYTLPSTASSGGAYDIIGVNGKNFVAYQIHNTTEISNGFGGGTTGGSG